MKIKVFDYMPELDCFVVRPEFKSLMERLGISEWTPVVWLGRLFIMDNDYGEHWFDNWDEREEVLKRAKELGKEQLIPYGFEGDELMIVVPDKFVDHGHRCYSCRGESREIPLMIESMACPKCGAAVSVSPDGPCHDDSLRKRFWTDVLDSLTLDLETIFEKARDHNNFVECGVAEYGQGIAQVLPIDEIIGTIKEEYGV